MKKLIFPILIIMMSINLISCTAEWPNIYGADLIPGPWENSGYNIQEIGFGEYKVYNTRKKVYSIEYLDAFTFYYGSVPEGCWPERYEPYYSTLYDELCWHLYCRGPHSEILIFKSGKWAPI